MRRLLLVSIGTTLAILLLGPWVIYELGLSNIDGLPEPQNITPISSAETEAVWNNLKESGPVVVKKLTPYDYIFSAVTNNSLPPGAKATWAVARNYNIGHLKSRRTILWHLSGAALTIWISRNWNTDQIVSKVYEISNAYKVINQKQQALQKSP